MKFLASHSGDSGMKKSENMYYSLGNKTNTFFLL